MSAAPAPSGPDRTFFLPEDVLFVPVDELAPSVRSALRDADGHLAVTRPGFRVPARLVDEPTAALLVEFRSASTIAEAVVRFSSRRGLDPVSTLDAAFPMLQLFTASEVLVLEGSPHAAAVPLSSAPGQLVGGFEIAAALQCTLDTEVYRARAADGRSVALKLEQAHAPSGTADALAREESALRRIGGGLAPEVVAAGLHQGRRFIALSWFDGVPVTTRAALVRHRAAEGWRSRLHRLACRVVARFERLHSLGIVHGDVHARNVLVGAGDEVQVIDFGMSRQPGRGAPLDHDMRTGFVWYMDPDAVRSLLEGGPPPAPDAASEAFALAALVYEILTGEHYLAFSPEVDAAYGQILSEPPLPFTRRGFESWPATEAVLQKALSKSAGERYASTAALGSTLRRAGPPRPRDLDAAFTRESAACVERFVPTLEDPPPPLRALFDATPVVACDQGAGGFAWFLYRLAVLRERPDLLALADIWIRRAAGALDAEDAFHAPPPETDGFRIDDCSILHRAPGVHYVRALVCQARADLAGLHEATEDFLAAAAPASGVADVTLGRAGVLLAATSLWSATAASSSLDTTRLAGAVGDLFDGLVLELDTEPEGLVARQPYSFAHGSAGILYALLRAAVVLRRPPPPRLALRLEALVAGIQSAAADDLEPALDGAGREREQDFIPGWCNGAAGLVPLFVLAGEVYRSPAYAELAIWAAERAASHPDRHAHLCCGLAGRVFALLHMFQHSGQDRWLEHARSLARHLSDPRLPARSAGRTYSLFWGPLGSALALEELRHPEWAAMPFFGDLGWPRP